MITNFKLFENYSMNDIQELANILMNDENYIDTLFGSTRSYGVIEMILNLDTDTTAKALMNYNDTIETLYGTKNLTAVTNMILNVYDYEKEQKVKDFNL